MTAAVFRSTPSMSVPLTQNTAPVLEFNCLYTHDSRKKQKKWQDGFLRYHTFNKRVMVYDVPRNFIGDMHWASENAVQDGDELTLERGGVRVEVGENIGQTETDLTELRKSKNKAPSAASSHAPTRTAQVPGALQLASGNVARINTHLKHKSLNALLGTPKGPAGKAQLPTRSPFEERHAQDEDEEWEGGRSVKRLRVEAIARKASTRKAVKQSGAPLLPRQRTSVQHQTKSKDTNQQSLGMEEVVDLSDGALHQNDFLPGFSSDILRCSSSSPQQRPVVDSVTFVRSISPACQGLQEGPNARRVQSSPLREVTVKALTAKPSSRKAGEKPPRLAADETSKQRRSDALRPNEDLVKTGSTTFDCDTEKTASNKGGQILRLPSTGSRKRTLLCHDQLVQKSRRLAATGTADADDSLLDKSDTPRLESRSLTTTEKLQTRLARIRAKRPTAQAPPITIPNHVRTVDDSGKEHTTVLVNIDENQPDGPPMGSDREEIASPIRQAQISDESAALELARLDQRMLPPAAPRRRKPVIGSVLAPAKSGITLQPPAKESRPLCRVLSESAIMPSARPKRVPGAPVRYTPSPTRLSRESTPTSGHPDRQVIPITQAVPIAPADKSKTSKPPRSPPDRTVYKKKGLLQRSVTLNMTSNGTSTVILSKPFQAPGQASAATSKWQTADQTKDLGPWSRDAFDLFNWRPPGWDEEKWCLDPIVADEGTTGASSIKSTNTVPLPEVSGGATFPTFGRPVV